MNMYEIITKKKNKEKLSKDEIDFFVKGVTDGSIPDYQTSALLMVVCLNGMDDEETWLLTDAMTHSGDVLDLGEIKGIKVDKHSTGGVGDKTSLVLTPMLAACGLKVAKMSGRALGHTGGTIDKLESIKGFSCDISEEKFFADVNEIGIAIAAQTADVAPADKKLYALRDVTATVDNVSLISSSIMSKKLACGADCIVLDVKTGSGSFMKTPEDSAELAEKMVNIGKRAGKNVSAVISDMDQPLGYAVGNALEVKEALHTLKGHGPEDLKKLCLTLGAQLLINANIAQNETEAEKLLEETIANGKAFEKFRQFVKAQGGDDSFIENEELLPCAKLKKYVESPCSGWVEKTNCSEIGMASLFSGAGREKKGDPVDFGAGIIVRKKVGDRVETGDILAEIYSSDKEKLDLAAKKLLDAYTFGEAPVQKHELIYKTVK